MPHTSSTLPSVKNEASATGYDKAGKIVSNLQTLLSVFLAGLATYLLSDGKIGGSICVSLAVLTGLNAVRVKITASTASLAAHIDEISRTVSSVRPA